MRAVPKAVEALALVSRQPSMDRPPVEVPLRSDLAHGATLADDTQHCLIPLFSHAQLPHGRDCDESTEPGETDQPKVWDASAEGLSGRVNRTTTRDWLGRECAVSPHSGRH